MKKTLLCIASTVTLAACGNSGNVIKELNNLSPPASGASATSTANSAPLSKPAAARENVTFRIKANQLGFIPNQQKIAVVPNVSSTTFDVIDLKTRKVVFTGHLSEPKRWDASGDTVKIADFSSFVIPGEYTISVKNIRHDAYPFEISDTVFSDAHDTALKAYYFNRASIALEPKYAGDWARPLAHPDTHIKIAPGAESAERKVGDIISSPKGWYDAGDYNKYVVNSGISTYTLLASYEHFSDFYKQRDINIPESGDNVPDILDEIKWNLDWLQTMQDTDGGVYHKLTTENFEGAVMPHEATAQRYVVQKNTPATLNFAAVMAIASRVYADYEEAFPGLSQAYKKAAIDAYDWANRFSGIRYDHKFSVTGEYGDATFNDEFSWAAAELFILTGEKSYLNEFYGENQDISIPSWPTVAALGYISLGHHGKDLLTDEQFKGIKDKIVNQASWITEQTQSSPFRVPMNKGDFYWGSNSVALNKGLMVYQAYALTGEQRFLDTVTSSIDYILGRNAVDLSFVTGVGDDSTQAPHHRQSYADNVVAPVPGFVAGGPNKDKQDKCPDYIGDTPALSYVDSWCSYASNEVTINWNAPLVYLLAALQAK